MFNFSRKEVEDLEALGDDLRKKADPVVKRIMAREKDAEGAEAMAFILAAMKFGREFSGKILEKSLALQKEKSSVQ